MKRLKTQTSYKNNHIYIYIILLFLKLSADNRLHHSTYTFHKSENTNQLSEIKIQREGIFSKARKLAFSKRNLLYLSNYLKPDYSHESLYSCLCSLSLIAPQYISSFS